MNRKELDCRGMACPEPVMRSKRCLDETHPDTLDVLVDNAAACENVTRFLGRNGYTVQSAQEGPDWRVTGTATSGCACTVTEAPLPEGRTVVLLTSETLGHGNDELGAKLMGNFIGSLPELGPSLWRIILLNGGVKLSATPGKSLDGLKALAAQGVSVLVCGTCLDFYHLLDAKEVGETTNMMDVVTSLALADKVIRP